MIHLAPVLIGKVISLFDNQADEDIELERIVLVATEEITSLHFRVLNIKNKLNRCHAKGRRTANDG